MAAFTPADPSDRAAFDVHYQRVHNDPAVTLRAVDNDNGLVGTVASFMMEGAREVSYWIDPARWGEGLASAALEEFLRMEATRPLLARGAQHNIGSAKVLARGGFVQIGAEKSYANGPRASRRRAHLSARAAAPRPRFASRCVQGDVGVRRRSTSRR